LLLLAAAAAVAVGFVTKDTMRLMEIENEREDQSMQAWQK